MPIKPYIEKIHELSSQLAVTEHKRQKIVEFMDQAPCVCYAKEADTGMYEYANSYFLTILGKTLDQVIGRTDIDLFSENTAKNLISHDIEVLKEGKSVVAIEAFYTAQHTRELFIVVKFLIVNGGKSIGAFAIPLPETFRLEQLDGYRSQS